MAWDFQTEPEFQKKLDWIERFVAEQLIPLEPLIAECSENQWQTIQQPLKQQVKEQGLWACHLEQ